MRASVGIYQWPYEPLLSLCPMVLGKLLLPPRVPAYEVKRLTRSNYNSRCSLQVGCLRPWQRCSAPHVQECVEAQFQLHQGLLAQSPEAAMSLQLSAVSPQLANLWRHYLSVDFHNHP